MAEASIWYEHFLESLKPPSFYHQSLGLGELVDYGGLPSACETDMTGNFLILETFGYTGQWGNSFFLLSYEPNKHIWAHNVQDHLNHCLKVSLREETYPLFLCPSNVILALIIDPNKKLLS